MSQSVSLHVQLLFIKQRQCVQQFTKLPAKGDLLFPNESNDKPHIPANVLQLLPYSLPNRLHSPFPAL